MVLFRRWMFCRKSWHRPDMALNRVSGKAKPRAARAAPLSGEARGSQAGGGPRAGAGPAWRLYSAGVAAARAKWPTPAAASKAAGAAAKGTAPPRHSTQCHPLAVGASGVVLSWSADGCVPSAEQSWCMGSLVGCAAKAGAITAAARDSVHQAMTHALSARVLRRWWKRLEVQNMVVRQVTAILPR